MIKEVKHSYTKYQFVTQFVIHILNDELTQCPFGTIVGLTTYIGLIAAMYKYT